MAKERMIVNLRNMEDAKKIEETVKTGYAETSVETILQWMAVEGDLADSYLRLSREATDEMARSTYLHLHEDSRKTAEALSGLLKSFEDLDRKRVERVHLLTGNLP